VAPYHLQGKVALITGGGRGIGLGIAAALAARGAMLALVDVDGEAVEQAAARFGSERAIGVAADVTSSTAMETAVAAAADRFGAVDVVVANAGIAPPPATVRAMPRNDFERVVEVNLLGVYRTVRAALDQVIQRRGQVVLVSSVYAFVNGVLLSPYAAAKAGVEQLGRALRVELAPHGASATVAYFGFVDTRMVQGALEGSPLAARMHERSPAFMRRRITADQAGEAVARAIERRRPRAIVPRFWAPMSILRGVFGPALDELSARTPRLQAVVREADDELGSRAPTAAAGEHDRYHPPRA